MLETLTFFISGAVIVALAWIAWYNQQRKRDIDWTTQTILITGGSNGIGWELVQEALKRKCKAVIIVDILEPRKIRTDGKLIFLKCNLSQPANIESLQGELRAKGLHPTILVNNAGVWNYGKRLTRLNSTELDDLIAVNLVAPIKITRALLPGMQQNGFGRIVNMSSLLGIGGVAKMSNNPSKKLC